MQNRFDPSGGGRQSSLIVNAKNSIQRKFNAKEFILTIYCTRSDAELCYHLYAKGKIY